MHCPEINSCKGLLWKKKIACLSLSTDKLLTQRTCHPPLNTVELIHVTVVNSGKWLILKGSTEPREPQLTQGLPEV